MFKSNLPGFYGSTGEDEIYWPSGFSAKNLDIYYAVDVATYYRTPHPDYRAGQEFHIVNGGCDELPGFLFGTSEIVIDPLLGLTTQAPLADAVLTTLTEEGVCSEPAGLQSLGGGIALVALARRRPRRIRL